MDFCSVAQGLGWGWSSKAPDEMPQQPPLSGSQSRPARCAGLGLHSHPACSNWKECSY